MRGNLLLVAAVITAGILLAEIILWIFFPVTKIPGNNKRIVVQITNLPGLKKYITYDENDFGFRSLSMHSVKKPSNTIRIICLGHSTTQQPTQATEDIWSSILEKKLQEKFRSKGIRIEVAARGKGGEGVKQNSFWAQENILQYQPDLVILLEGINDLWQEASKAKDVHAKNLPGENSDAQREDFFLQFSQIYRRLRILQYNFDLNEAIKRGVRLDWHSQNLPKFRRMRRNTPYVEKLQLDPSQIIAFSENLSALLKFFKKANVPVIVLGQPALWKAGMSADEMNALWLTLHTSRGWVRPSTEWLENEMTNYNNIQNRISDIFKVPYIDLDKRIPKNLQYFFDDCHFTDLGNIEIANEIFPEVEEQVGKIISHGRHQLNN